jgi:hypothetical protein
MTARISSIPEKARGQGVLVFSVLEIFRGQPDR